MKHPRRDYTNYKNITIDPLSNSNAVIVGILLIIIFYFVRKIDETRIIAISFTIISRLALVPWIYKISKKVGKDEVLWSIFGIISPSISLIILGFSDLKVSSLVAMKIVNKKRQEFRNEELTLKNIFIEDELIKKIEELKNTLNNEMQEELKNYYK